MKTKYIVLLFLPSETPPVMFHGGTKGTPPQFVVDDKLENAERFEDLFKAESVLSEHIRSASAVGLDLQGTVLKL